MDGGDPRLLPNPCRYYLVVVKDFYKCLVYIAEYANEIPVRRR